MTVGGVCGKLREFDGRCDRWLGLKSPFPQHRKWLVEIGTQASLRACVRGLEELRDRDLRLELADIRVLTRIFHGVHDKVVPFDLADVQSQLIKGAELVRFEKSGHATFHDEKDKLVDELVVFAAAKIPVAAGA